MNLKLKAELPKVVEAFEKVKKHIPAYIDYLNKEGKYKDLETRLSMDLLRATMGSNWICGLYDKYDCNDDHITSLAKAALRKVYPIK